MSSARPARPISAGFSCPDAGRLAEEDARLANRHGYSRHEPALPLFTETDAFRVLANLQPVGFDRPVPVMPGVEVRFLQSGHLLGSAFAVLTIAGNGRADRRIVFSGDLGRYDRPILPDPLPIDEADVLVVESTYGNRVHAPDREAEQLAEIIRETVARGGKLIIPAFAVGRVEEVIYWLKKLEDARRIPILPVYVDSPMAVEALQYYTRRSTELDSEMRTGRGEVSAFMTTRFQTVTSTKQSDDLVASGTPCIILSSSGMATGGRVLNHLKAALPNPKNTVLFSGFQAAGTRGRSLVEGATEVKIHGTMVPVLARIEQIESMSAHADSEELMRWLRGFQRAPEMTCLVHGEPESMDAFKRAIESQLGWRVKAPEYLDTVTV